MRSPRYLEEGARYHVTIRANRQEMIFKTDLVKEMFIEILYRAKEKYSFLLQNFCIMGNHVHLIIQPIAGACLSRIMQWIAGVFAMNYNREFGLTGHVWGERFFSRIIRNLAHFLMTMKYVDQNPVKAKLVAEPIEWVYSGSWHEENGISDLIDDE